MSYCRSIPFLSFQSLSRIEAQRGALASFFSNALVRAKDMVNKETVDVFPLTILSKHPLYQGAMPFVYALFTRTNSKKYTPKPKNMGSQASAEQHSGPVDAFATIPEENIIASIETWKYAVANSVPSRSSSSQSESDISRRHMLLFNKYPVIPDHIVIVSDGPLLSQYEFLDLPDMIALWTCVVGMDGLGFYNAGDESGASQPRRHVQFVPNSALVEFLPAPLPQNGNPQGFVINSPLDRAIATFLLALDADKETIAQHLDASIREQLADLQSEDFRIGIKEGKPFSLPYLPYKHGIILLPEDLSTKFSNKEAAEFLYDKYKELCAFLDITKKNGDRFRVDNGTDSLLPLFHEYANLSSDERVAFNESRLANVKDSAHDFSCHSHNLLLTKNYMFIVPRRNADRMHVSINSLGFAGYMIGREFDYDFVTPKDLIDASATVTLQPISTPTEAIREVVRWTQVAQEVYTFPGDVPGPLALLLHCGVPPNPST